MANIKVVNGKFICPMLNAIIPNKDVTIGMCAKCKYNTLGQIVNDIVYCRYTLFNTTGGSASDGTGNVGGSVDEIIDPWEMF